MFNQNEIPPILNTADCFIITLIVFLGVITRFWLNGWPDYETFDEVHFGGFTNGYIKQEYFFDIHPPLAKLLIALVSYFSNYKGNIDFESLFSKKYFDKNSNDFLIDYVTLRLVPQLFSSFVPVLIYITMRIMHFSIVSSITSSSLLIFETSIICEGRFILTDGILHFFVSLHLLSLFYTCQYPSLSSLIADGLTLGFACSCKSTAWGLPILNGFVHIYFLIKKHHQNLIDKIPVNIGQKNDKNSKIGQLNNSKANFLYLTQNFIFDVFTRGILLIFLLLLVYYFTFVIHICILRYDGPGSDFLEKSVKKTLLHSKSSFSNTTFSIEPLSKRNQGPSMMYRFLSLNIEMYKSNMRIKSFHPYQSDPLSWPLLTSTYVAFITFEDDREIDCLGNIFVYYPSFFSILFIILYYVTALLHMLINYIFFQKKKVHNSLDWRFFFIVFGYLINYIPFLLVPRCMFLYHYQISLIFACMAVGVVLEIIFFIPSRIKEKNLEQLNISKILPNYLSDKKNPIEKVDFDVFKKISKIYLKKNQKTDFLKIFGIFFASLIITLAFIGFLIYYPFIYGTEISYNILPLKVYRKFLDFVNVSYRLSPHDLYQKAFIPDNWIWGDSYHRERYQNEGDSE